MRKPITRRDFLNGAALAVAAGSTLSPRDLFAQAGEGLGEGPLSEGHYPPTLTGMRGHHEGADRVTGAATFTRVVDPVA